MGSRIAQNEGHLPKDLQMTWLTCEYISYEIIHALVVFCVFLDGGAWGFFF